MARPDKPRKSARRFSLWTLLAPIALVGLVFMIFQSVGESGILGNDRDEAAVESPGKDAGDTGSAGGTTATGTTTTGAKPRRVRVKPGETLGTIAERYDVSVTELEDANPNLRDPHNLQVGQVIKLP